MSDARWWGDDNGTQIMTIPAVYKQLMDVDHSDIMDGLDRSDICTWADVTKTLGDYLEENN